MISFWISVLLTRQHKRLCVLVLILLYMQTHTVIFTNWYSILGATATQTYRVIWRSLYLDPLHRWTLHLQKSVEKILESLKVFPGHLKNTKIAFVPLFIPTFAKSLIQFCPISFLIHLSHFTNYSSNFTDISSVATVYKDTDKRPLLVQISLIKYWSMLCCSIAYYLAQMCWETFSCVCASPLFFFYLSEIERRTAPAFVHH